MKIIQTKIFQFSLKVKPLRIIIGDHSFSAFKKFSKKTHISYPLIRTREMPVFQKTFVNISAGIYLLKVNNRNTGTRFKICSKLSIKIPERHQWRRSGIFIVNFEHNSHLVLVFLLLTLNI